MLSEFYIVPENIKIFVELKQVSFQDVESAKEASESTQNLVEGATKTYDFVQGKESCIDLNELGVSDQQMQKDAVVQFDNFNFNEAIKEPFANPAIGVK